jgi:hypothetical protein
VRPALAQPAEPAAEHRSPSDDGMSRLRGAVALGQDFQHAHVALESQAADLTLLQNNLAKR